MSELEISYGWQCTVCGKSSFITFADSATAVDEATRHADERHDSASTGIEIVPVATETYEDGETGDWYDED